MTAPIPPLPPRLTPDQPAILPAILRFFVQHDPVPQPRGRIVQLGKHPGVVVPSKHPVHSFKAAVRAAAYLAHRGDPLTGPLRVDLDVLTPRPGRLRWKSKPMPRVWQWAYCGPDKDNFEKSVFDAMSGLIFRDDGQICDGRTRKFIAAGDEQTGVLITVVPLLGEA